MTGRRCGQPTDRTDTQNGANLEDADLARAILRSTDLNGARLYCTDLERLALPDRQPLDTVQPAGAQRDRSLGPLAPSTVCPGGLSQSDEVQARVCGADSGT